MLNALIVFTSGGLGCLLRYLLTISTFGSNSKALTILLINLFGSFCAGLSLTAFPNNTLWIITGFLGGFTTFSAFSLEVLKLFNSSPMQSLIYILLSAFSCVIAAWCGSLTASLLLK